MVEHKERVRAQFGGSAEEYVKSAGHAAGDDLDQLVAWAEGGPDKVALDVATGGGHTALAMAALHGRVVASDLTQPMLDSAEAFIRGRGVTNVAFRQADAEALPFDDAAFDCVTCRIAPHHFPDVARFVAEVARVLKPGGLFLLEDSISPDDPDLAAYLNHFEALRDPTHIRAMSAQEWRDLLAAHDLAIEAEQTFHKDHPFDGWVGRSRTPAAVVAEIEDTLRAASPAARDAFQIEIAPDGKVLSYTDTKIGLKARRQALGVRG